MRMVLSLRSCVSKRGVPAITEHCNAGEAVKLGSHHRCCIRYACMQRVASLFQPPPLCLRYRSQGAQL